jgi:hypothetical protein
MDPNDRAPTAGPTPEQARAAAPDPARTRPAPLPARHDPGDASHEHETRADRIGEAARTEEPPERAAPVTPAPPRVAGRESASDRFLGEKSDDAIR